MFCSDSFLGKLKRMEKNFVFILSFFLVVCSFAGCKNSDDAGKDNDEKTVVDNGSDNEEKGDEKDAVEDAPDEEEDENKYNPLELPNYVYYSDESKTNKYNDVSVIALLGENYKNDELISSGSILGVKDNTAVFTYSTSSYSLKSEEELKEIEQSEYESKYNYSYKQHLIAVNTQDMTVIKDIEIGSDGVAYSYDGYVYICSRDYDNNKTSIMLYDYNLDVVYEHEFENYITLYFDGNLKNGYYIEDSKLKCICIDDNSVKEIATTDYFKFNYLSGVITSQDGKVYVAASANAVNTKCYSVIIDVATGDSVKVLDEDAPFINGEAFDKLVLQKYEETGKITYIYLSDCKKGIAYSVANNIDTVGFNVLPDGKILIEKCVENTIELYELEDGKLLASTDISFDAALTDDYSKFTDCRPQIFKDAQEEFDYEVGEGVYGVGIMSGPVQLDDGSIIFEAYAQNYCYYVKWKPQKDNLGTDIVTVSDFAIDSLNDPNLETKIDASKYVPGEVSSDLKILREKADELEKKYSVEIYIGEECRNIFGGYAMDPLTNYSKVETAITALESQLKRYPQGFFKQFVTDYTKGLKIYLTSTITGVDEENLEYAGGFQNTIDEYSVVVIDSNYETDIIQTFNHELSHAIEGVIWEKCLFDSDYCLSDENWEKLNPQIGSTVYTYNYSDFGYEDYYKYAFENKYEENDDTYFVDYYSMTKPTEDRARLFEEIMTGRYGVDFDKAPHLKDKLNYYSKCIRKAFDTTGWGTQPWEKYYN